MRSDGSKWNQFLRGYAMSFVFSLPASLFMPQRTLPFPVVAALFALPFALFIWMFNQTGLPRLRRPSFLATVVLQTLGYFAVVSLSFGCAFWIYLSSNYRVLPFHPRVGDTLAVILVQPSVHLSVAITVFLIFVISAIRAISRKLGPGVLRNWMLGYYHQPRQERRIFMFLDLRDSTALGERLGDLKFSALIRDFFADMTDPLLDSRGEVSHYIGDEAVLTWKVANGLRDAACIRFFSAFRGQIARNSVRYRARYGVVPDFKAGIHIGPVVATEVGEIKSEIVYHGDTLNTAARIQSLCNEFGEELLVSGALMAELDLPQGYQATPLGSVRLKGKEEPVDVVSIRPVQARAPRSADDLAAVDA